MRLLVLAVLLLASVSFGQGVSRSTLTLEDLAVLLGDAVAIDVPVPRQATVLRMSFGVGAERGEYSASLDHGGRREPPSEVRLLVQAPAWETEPEVTREVVRVHVMIPDGSSATMGPFDVPKPDPGPAWKHELVVESQPLRLDAWAPVYVRAWTLAVAGDEVVDLERAFVVQVWFGRGDPETVDPGPPLDAEALAQLGVIRFGLMLEPPTR